VAKKLVEYETKGPDASGRGVYDENEFTVKEGSLARSSVVPSCKEVIVKARELLLSTGVLEASGQSLRFVKDHRFPSPSRASSVLLGRSSNGWEDWKLRDGRSLSQVERVSREEGGELLTAAKRQAILDRHQKLVDEEVVPPQAQLDANYQAFRERFGPSILKGLEGESLLNHMHDSSKDSLIYWLEFKNDEEFQARRFGSIAGGSALKFRIFRRKKTGTWQAGSKQGNRPEDISVEEAIEYATSHRDQLLRGCELLEALPLDATDEQYAELQDQMDEIAPDVSRLAWGHKYFSLLFPEKLDTYHSPNYQRFHLLKLLQPTPRGDGRYICAGRFFSVAQEVGLSIHAVCRVLNTLDGDPHDYWRIGTNSGSTRASHWEMMKDRGCVAIGWPKLGDLSWLKSTKQSREELGKLLAESYPNHASAVGNAVSQISQFTTKLKEGDIVLAASGSTILGVGRVLGSYSFDAEQDFAHQRPVEWLNLEEWELPKSKEGLRSTVRKLGKQTDNLIAIEKRIQTSATDLEESASNATSSAPPKLSGVQARIQSVLDRKGQVILYGPPGTGKTYWAEKTANELAARARFDRSFAALDDVQQMVIQGEGEKSGLVRLCCFHPAYGYEDFLEGYRPETVDGHVSFQLRDGVFKALCKDAQNAPNDKFYLIVDEINRGDIPRIFGELLTTLEKDKRGKKIVLPVSQEVFTVPKNIFLIGTMNTADRSISLLDAALRRRFGFVEMMPDGDVLSESSVAGIPLRAWFEALNDRIRQHVGRDSRNLQIGHSYLMHAGSPLTDLAALKRAIRDDIIPLLEEYSYEDYTTLAAILGEQLVDVASQRICHELFSEGQDSELVQALLAPCPDISATPEAISSEKAELEADEIVDDEDDEEDEDEEEGLES